MIKIIGGTYRSRVIDTPSSTTTLPTKNMVRGAMLSSLGPSVNGANVLDLFAGSGALGIECLSRGASSCVFVEKDRMAYEVVKGNLAKLRISNGEAIQADYQVALNSLKHRKFDIVLLDPPYAMKESYQAALSYLLKEEMLSDEAAIILEYEGDIEFDETPFGSIRRYHYGKTNVVLLRK